jgi:hypothetical protein
MAKPSFSRIIRLLSIILFCGFIGFCFVVGGSIFWQMDPFNFRAPSDQELITAFHDHREIFERLHQVKTEGLKHVSSINDSAVVDEKNAGRKPDDAGSSVFFPILSVMADYDGTTTFVLAEGELLATGPGWAKGIAYIPGDNQTRGSIQQNLDNARKLPPGVYLRQNEPHWFIYYQND